MSRLDSLSKDELKKLYARSAALSGVGDIHLILIVIAFLSLICSLILISSEPSKEIIYYISFMIFTLFPFFASAYVFKYVRTPAARTYICVWSITGIVFSGLALLFGIYSLQSGEVAIVSMIGGIILLLLSIGALISARTDALFEAEAFTHKQIALARKKMRKGECFSDEDLPKSYPNPTFAKVCEVCAFIWVYTFVLFCFLAIIDAFFIPAQ